MMNQKKAGSIMVFALESPVRIPANNKGLRC